MLKKFLSLTAIYSMVIGAIVLIVFLTLLFIQWVGLSVAPVISTWVEAQPTWVKIVLLVVCVGAALAGCQVVGNAADGLDQAPKDGAEKGEVI